jgi:hypothetical protein
LYGAVQKGGPAGDNLLEQKIVVESKMLVSHTYPQRTVLLLLAYLSFGSAAGCPTTDSILNADVCVYGGTAGGVVAAVAAARMNRTVILLNPTGHLGGMMSGGLGNTDGKDSGGIAAEFFKRVGGYQFTPSAAESVFNTMVANESIDVRHHCLVTATETSTETGRIASLTTTLGGSVRATAFIDASYEGDLMAAAGIKYTVGREANTTYGESAAGRLAMPPVWGCKCNWNLGDVNGIDSTGKLLPMVHGRSTDEVEGAGDEKVQAYNFRLCLTRIRTNQVPFPAPTKYDPAQWELLRRAANARGGTLGFDDFFYSHILEGTNKTDTNNGEGRVRP